MSSLSSKSLRRVPRQERSERRVAEFLIVAAAVIVEAGYEGTTMTRIAERANASIGALYQYFPNKESVARALRQQYADEMEACWLSLEPEIHTLAAQQLAGRIIDVMVRFMQTHPAYIPLLTAPVQFKRDQAARDRLRSRFAGFFQTKNASLSGEDAFRMANVVLQVVKGMSPLYAAAKEKEREALIAEFKTVVGAYLALRLGD